MDEQIEAFVREICSLGGTPNQVYEGTRIALAECQKLLATSEEETRKVCRERVSEELAGHPELATHLQLVLRAIDYSPARFPLKD
jgi:hypothetical protein